MSYDNVGSSVLEHLYSLYILYKNIKYARVFQFKQLPILFTLTFVKRRKKKKKKISE